VSSRHCIEQCAQSAKQLPRRTGAAAGAHVLGAGGLDAPRPFVPVQALICLKRSASRRVRASRVASAARIDSRSTSRMSLPIY